MVQTTKIFFMITCLWIAALFSGDVFSGTDNPQDTSIQKILSSSKPVDSVMYGLVYLSGEVSRKSGAGNCGPAPWSKGCTNNMRVWWGLQLKAAVSELVLIIPDGENRWVITNHPDVLSRYPNLADPKFNNSYNGLYAQTSIDFSQTSGCSGSLQGNPFTTQVMGVRTYDYLKLIFSSQAKESMTGKCGNVPIDSEQTTWRWDVAAALSGNPEDMTAILNPEDQLAAGVYQHTFETNVNPSPEARDHVKAIVQLSCATIKSGPGIEAAPCPWQK